MQARRKAKSELGHSNGAQTIARRQAGLRPRVHSEYEQEKATQDSSVPSIR